MSTTPEASDSIAALQRAYESGTAEPHAVTQTAFRAIDAQEPALNAWTARDETGALAACADRERERDLGYVRGPLHAVPIAIKDLMHVRGLATTYGSPVHDNAPAPEDARLVRRLRDAGAILLGKTNCLEYGYGIAHPDVGQTHNPWNPQRTAGGSSGGSAAAVAVGQAWGATGTDSGGSIRIPAAYCGIVGVKPTYGLVPLDGVQPLSWSLDHAGPLARSCADAAVLLSAMAARSMQPVPRKPRDLKLAVIREHAEDPDLEPEVGRVLESALDALASAGATIVRVSISALRHADDALMNVIAPEASVVHAGRLERAPESFAEDTRKQLETGFAIPAVAHVRAQRYRRYLGERLLAALGDADALVGPTVPWTAREWNPPLDDPTGAAEMRYIGPYNLTGLPALSLPCGLAGDGLPIGLQAAGRPHGDDALLSVAAGLEGVFGTFRPPRFTTA